MGVEYHIVSEQAESGYELGKGPATWLGHFVLRIRLVKLLGS